MRLAVVSDTHFGDDLCTLVRPRPVQRDGLARELEYAGAEVLVYETGRGVRSIPIRAGDLTLP